MGGKRGGGEGKGDAGRGGIVGKGGTKQRRTSDVEGGTEKDTVGTENSHKGTEDQKVEEKNEKLYGPSYIDRQKCFNVGPKVPYNVIPGRERTF